MIPSIGLGCVSNVRMTARQDPSTRQMYCDCCVDKDDRSQHAVQDAEDTAR